MRYLPLLLLFLTMLDRRLRLPVEDNRGLDRWSVWVGLGAQRCSLLFSTLYMSYLTYSIVALQYSNYCYPVHILPYAYNIQNYTHQSTGRPWLYYRIIRPLSQSIVKHNLVTYPSSPLLIPEACWLADLGATVSVTKGPLAQLPSRHIGVVYA